MPKVMKKGKRLIMVLAVLLVLLSGAATAYAVSAGGEGAQAPRETAVLEDYAAEEMAVGIYYETGEEAA